ncbi:hypothetical protein [Leptothoe spongobia]|uniref:Uncharacterized protein n=1 Tax=Leptothoe spongobia TAU-MAC 1115 TaxID=1967444 RepID=A0A947GK87_9CYAN|nr:hypothetical protein [Leptothoe spongobia]MBT9316107.1 hypothetical protein [Leptothoe spongobia TAU-MAC 1115]
MWDTNYTFRSYFELPHDTDEILAEFGYGYAQGRIKLPRTTAELSELDALKRRIERVLPHVQLTSEVAKREVLVAPILTEVATICNQTLRFEYLLKVNNWLQGSLDYLIRAETQIVVIEAKRDDLTRGFTQLAAEMIALGMIDNTPEKIYGAVTMGSLWVFGVLDRGAKLITQDIGSYRVPDDLEDLVRVLVGILEGNAH